MLNPTRLAAGVILCLGCLLPAPAMAYIGPGVGLGAIAVTAALFAGLLLLVAGLVWYPLKRALRARRKNIYGPE